MITRFACTVACLFVVGCSTAEEAQVVGGVLTTPEVITREWADNALLKVKQGEVQTIICNTNGGDAEGALALAEELQTLHTPVRVAVPYNNSCVSAGAIIWFSSPYRTAAGSVVLHIVGNIYTRQPNAELNKKVIEILERAGASKRLQDKIRYGRWEKGYALTKPEIFENFRSPE